MYICKVNTNNGLRLGTDAEEIGETLFFSENDGTVNDQLKNLSEKMNIPIYEDGKDYMIY